MNLWASTISPFALGYGGNISDVSDDIYPLSNAGLFRAQTLQDEVHIDQSEDGGSLLGEAVLQCQDARRRRVGCHTG